jgi:hypothetical protein
MLSGIWDLECKCVKNHGQCLLSLFTSTQKTTKFAWNLCKIGWENPYTDFVEVVDGTANDNFPIYHLVHFCWEILRKTQPNRATLKYLDSPWNTPARDVAGASCLPALYLTVHVHRGRPTPLGPCIAPWVPVCDARGPVGRCHTTFPQPPDGRTALVHWLVSRRTSPPSPCTSSRHTVLHTATPLPWHPRNTVTTTRPAIKAMTCPPRASTLLRYAPLSPPRRPPCPTLSLSCLALLTLSLRTP